jgi:hypothetical protein
MWGGDEIVINDNLDKYVREEVLQSGKYPGEVHFPGI